MFAEMIDRLAGAWISNRMDRAVAELKKQPGYEELRLEKANFDKDGWSMDMIHHDVALLAASAAEMLSKQNAKNYVQMVMFPKLGSQPIEVTVRWYWGGLTPAEKNIQLETELNRIRERAVIFAGQLQAWGYHDAAAQVLTEIITGPVEAPDYFALARALAETDPWRCTENRADGTGDTYTCIHCGATWDAGEATHAADCAWAKAVGVIRQKAG